MKANNKNFNSIMFSMGMYLFTIAFIVFTVSLVTFISYQKITKASSSQARVIIVEDEVVIEYKEFENEDNID